MAVVINEFEVVAEPEHRGDSGAGSGRETPSGTTAEASTPRDIERIVRRLDTRAMRVYAD
jgi:hypothetical protein